LVEKDYWIVFVLRKLVAKFGDLIIFKGGTSLSKCGGLIDRFSEDIDVLLDASECSSKTMMEKRTSELRKFLASLPELTYLRESSFPSKIYGKLFFSYESVFDEPGNTLLVEAGFRGGTDPNEVQEITSMIGELLIEKGKDPDEYKPFQIRVIHMNRTLVEKLFALASAYKTKELSKKTRHYYDTYCLLKKISLDQFVGTQEFIDIVKDIERVSKEYFGSDEDLSTLLKSHAFNLSDNEYHEVQKGYEADKELYFAGQPPFEEVYAAVCQGIELIRKSVK
jgi:hypothetical protein